MKKVNRFVVHKHIARQLHYDFRLELDGVLKSWAVPKGLPQESGIKRLAVAVEDHPISYLDFEGEIPEGEYGAGQVEIWDRGTYQLLSRTPSKVEFILEGGKLKGRYLLIEMRGKSSNWLLMKVRT
jgi:DNA ligase D-like protein (predicted 3'-phosphoesterase)